MEAEKTRVLINMWYGQQVYQDYKFKTKQEAQKIEQDAHEELQKLEDLSDTAENIGSIWRLCKEGANDGQDVIVRFEKWLNHFESKLKL